MIYSSRYCHLFSENRCLKHLMSVPSTENSMHSPAHGTLFRPRSRSVICVTDVTNYLRAVTCYVHSPLSLPVTVAIGTLGKHELTGPKLSVRLGSLCLAAWIQQSKMKPGRRRWMIKLWRLEKNVGESVTGCWLTGYLLTFNNLRKNTLF